MSPSTAPCPQCGAQSSDLEWCDVCGTQLGNGGDVDWLEVGQAFQVELDGAVRMARIESMLESYVTRRVLLARLAPAGSEDEFFSRAELDGGQDEEEIRDQDSAEETAPNGVTANLRKWPQWLIEETDEDRSLEPDAINDELMDLVHRPLASVDRTPRRRVDVFDAPAGVPLQEFLESQGRLLTLEEASNLVLLLMDAVERVHDAGLLHFQVCPWTLRIAPRVDDDANNALDLADPDQLRVTFGGVRGFYDGAVPVQSHPVILGFSPPEFFGRAQGALDGRADIFGVGMLLYYLIAGAAPPTGALTRHVPSVGIRAFRYELAPGLHSFFERCIAPEPKDRFATIAEARESLEAALDYVAARTVTEPVPARSPVSTFTAVDRHIGINKGRRTPINQDAVFLGTDPRAETTLIAVADGVSTASYGSGDVASRLLVEAAARFWMTWRTRTDTVHDEPPMPALDDAPTASEDDMDAASPLMRISGEPESLDGMSRREREDEAADEPPSVDLETTSEVSPIPRETPERVEETPLSPVSRVSLVGERTAAHDVDTRAAQILDDIIDDANTAISTWINKRHHPFDGPAHEVMGTTALLAWLEADQITIASLGDSRAYLLRDNCLECLTRDHNLATMRIIEGFPADECLALPQGMALARCLGTFDVVEGTLMAVKPEPDLMTFRLLPGDVILLTTDGLVDFAGPTEQAAERNIKSVLLREEIPALAALRLMVMANEGGGEDNIGVAVIRVTAPHEGARMPILQAFPAVPELESFAMTFGLEAML
jgi:serine/threonine protein phosphatase PrpC